jgi:PIN like domain
LKVFLDNNLSPHLAHGLNTLLEPEGDQVVHLSDKFPRNIADQDWIEFLADEGGWVVISADRRIGRNPIEREAWRRSRLVVFLLAPQWGKSSSIEIAWRLLRSWVRIRDTAAMMEPPAAFEVPFSSTKLRVLRR